MTTPIAPAGVIDFLLHPPLGSLHPKLDHFGPYLDMVTLTRWLDAAPPGGTVQYVSATYGVIVQLNGALPPSWGSNEGWRSDDGLSDEAVYFPPLAQVYVQHQFPGSFWITSQTVSVSTIPKLVLWQENYPGRIGLLVSPNLAVDLFYLSITP